MKRRTFLILTAIPFVPPSQRGLEAIVKEINAANKEYAKLEKLLAERMRYFEPRTDPTIKGWARRMGDLSETLTNAFRAWAEL